ncbi:MAG: TauD/TfdA family dioxygenase [Betaproteobacteria bacterium]|nr:MAG: TauD/TfdA family dioxygenase [Betaproteobacteria bacterium]
MFARLPLCTGFGVEIDVDVSQPLSDDAFAEIERAFYAGQVLAIRGQSLTPRQFASFAARFGPPQPHVIDQFHHPEDPNILILSNVKKNGQPTGLQDAGSNAMKKRIAPLHGVHHYGNRHDVDEQSRTAASPLTAEQKAKMPLITHKIARPHPITGRISLYAVSGSSFGIVGMPDDEARDLLDELAAHSTSEKYRYAFKYGVGDIVVWDNASLLHSATLIDPDDARTLWRITIKETRRQA